MDKSDSTALAQAENEDIWTLRWAQNTNDYQPDNETEGVESMFEAALYPCFGEEGDREDYGIQLIDDKESSGFLRGRLVSDAMDMKTVATWIDRCQAQHGDQCVRKGIDTRSLKSLPFCVLKELLVIDVENLCLCYLPQDAQYAALSYVWGGANTILTLKQTKAAFSKPNGLAVKLPRTIRDAINVTKALNMRFLWVDSLCIPQDDGTKKSMLINAMDAIYGQALITLVAATGDNADSGLSGWSSKLGRSQCRVDLGDDLRLGVLPYYQRELLHCEHATRAWTYQETCLSPRCLIFLNGLVYLNCNAAVYSECVDADVPGIVPEASANTLGKTDDISTTAIERYAHHVRAYTSRSLTYQSDISNAFSGIRTGLTRTMHDHYIYLGIPKSCFDWAILWTGHGSLRRRIGFPSWTWMGWEGAIQMSPTHDTDYDQMWLLQGTWIDWQQQDIFGTCAILPIHEPMSHRTLERVQCIVESVTKHEEIKFRKSSTAERRDMQYDQNPGSSGSSSEDDSSDEHREWGEWCPAYGTPTQGNQFGRTLEHNEARETAGCMQLSSSCQSIKAITCKNPGPRVLSFSAPVIRFSAGTAISTTNDYPFSTLLDKEGRVCGFLSVHDSDSWSNSGPIREVKLLLMSVMPFGALTSYNGPGHISTICNAFEAGDDILNYLEGWPRSVDNFDFLNVMFVLETTERVTVDLADASSHNVPVHERSGIGFVYRKAVSDVKWEHIVLM